MVLHQPGVGRAHPVRTPSPAASTAATRVVAVDAGSRSLVEVEHLAALVDEVLAGTAEESAVLSSHHVTEPDRHYAAVLSWTGGPARDEVTRALAAGIDGVLVLREDDLAAALGHGAAALPGLAVAIADHTNRTAGRLARYPGRRAIERRLTAAEIVRLSCVEEVVGLAGVEIQPQRCVDLTGFARPQWRAGRCVLLVQQGAADLLPFEARQQIPCCADH